MILIKSGEFGGPSLDHSGPPPLINLRMSPAQIQRERSASRGRIGTATAAGGGFCRYCRAIWRKMKQITPEQVDKYMFGFCAEDQTEHSLQCHFLPHCLLYLQYYVSFLEFNLFKFLINFSYWGYYLSELSSVEEVSIT